MEYLVPIVEWTLVYHPKISVGRRARTQTAGFSDSERFFLRLARFQPQGCRPAVQL